MSMDTQALIEDLTTARDGFFAALDATDPGRASIPVS